MMVKYYKKREVIQAADTQLHSSKIYSNHRLVIEHESRGPRGQESVVVIISHMSNFLPSPRSFTLVCGRCVEGRHGRTRIVPGHRLNVVFSINVTKTTTVLMKLSNFVQNCITFDFKRSLPGVSLMFNKNSRKHQLKIPKIQLTMTHLYKSSLVPAP